MNLDKGNLVSFLIHIGYEAEIRLQLCKLNITARDDLDPLDPSIICDPALVNEHIDRKVQLARKSFLHKSVSPSGDLGLPFTVLLPTSLSILVLLTSNT
ncbi:hypothetical protein G6F37_003471 [Rhizopus arrhizus]|nr:hypothetical protein G6F38_009392 [Rhizopus arrhizus]KAG1161011.1 hypothetical protein G6F37_003471 [Rhizopus arrhizus]